MEPSVLVDSSFFISHLRAGQDPFRELAGFAEVTDFYTCGVVMVEVLRGVKVPKWRERMRELFEAMIYVPTPNHMWARVEERAWHMDRSGLIMKVPDLVIATCAIEVEAAILTIDSDFDMVPGLRVLNRLQRRGDD